jgi:predicted HicB family RNase H-like nuclease
MTILNYRGYQGSVEYEDKQLVIQLLHIDDFITTVCDSAAQAEDAFHELVDDYLETCEETGQAPNKPYKGSLNVRMQPRLHRHLAMAATSAGVSLNAWIVRACETAIAAQSQSQRVGVHSQYRPSEYSPVFKPDRTKQLPESNRFTFSDHNIVDLPELKRINKRRVDELRSPPGEYDGQTRTG